MITKTLYSFIATISSFNFPHGLLHTTGYFCWLLRNGNYKNGLNVSKFCCYFVLLFYVVFNFCMPPFARALFSAVCLTACILV